MSDTDEVARPTSARRRSLVAAAVAVAGAGLIGGTVVWLTHRQPQVPYHDAGAAGRLTLCSSTGHSVTAGSTTDTPFASFVVADAATPTALAGAGHGATLFAYQPRSGVDPSEFSGTQLTGLNSYSDRKRPAAKLSKQSTSLAAFIAGYPLSDDGFVQLRLVLSSGEASGSQPVYSSVDLHVDGTRWTAIDPGHDDCRATGAALIQISN